MAIVNIEEREGITVGYSNPLRNNCIEKIAMGSKHDCGQNSEKVYIDKC